MSVSAVNSYNINQMLSDYTNSRTESLLSSGGRTSASSKQAYGASMTSEAGMDAMKRALSEIEPNGSGQVTFAMIDRYREKQEEIFTNTLKTALKEYGVDPEAKFNLVATSDGQLQVNCSDPEQKAKIEAYFKENPAMQSEFMQLQALGNMSRARNSLTMGSSAVAQAKAMTMSFQAEALEAFFSDAFSSGMGYSSLMGDYGSDYGNYYLGANYVV